MPKTKSIKSILVLGAGPIVIGQACEFDYSGAQACKALKEEGYKVILVNSNPATIMTDPEIADRTYIEPIHWKVVKNIIKKEKPNALLPTMGGQTALNCALDLYHKNILSKYKIKMIGATIKSIKKAENRKLFRKSIKKLNLRMPKSGIANSLKKAFKILKKVKFPCIIRPSFTMGGTGGGIAYNQEEFKEICKKGLNLSPNKELLIDESLIGWKEYEMEVVRDKNDNCIIVCSIENFDPMGIHTGDSITVSPAQTLTDKEYQKMRNASIKILKEIGIETGGSNVQFAINPKNGKMVVIEMNPRVSRSSALASKATGFPIAKIAAKLAIGYTLDELNNSISGINIPASFEPTIDYIVTKIPRFNFDKFPESNDRLTTQMKSVGEVMAIGRNFQESIQKAIRSLEINSNGFDSKINLKKKNSINKIKKELKNPGPYRLWYIGDAFRKKINIKKINKLTSIDIWFLYQIKELIEIEQKIKKNPEKIKNKYYLKKIKNKGFSDKRIAILINKKEKDIRKLRYKKNIYPVYKRIDSCAAEFKTSISYMYSTWEEECESKPTLNKKKIIILGSGPNRIGQGIEFDYCCVHSAQALRENNFETIIINCNPETVSTDYDISDRLYFEPITLETILEIIRIEKPKGIIIQFGGQTPLKLAKKLKKKGIKIIGTNANSIDKSENRNKFQKIISELNLKQPKNFTVKNYKKAKKKAKIIKYPIMIRPSYVLGGKSMEIIYNKKNLKKYFNKKKNKNKNILFFIDHYLENAIEVDVDAVCDKKNIFIGGIMQHIEQAGIHSGDSACSLPSYSLKEKIIKLIKIQVKKISLKLKIKGLINIQFAIKKKKIYIIEVNPRASRTIPFISKATNIPLAKIATKVMIGISLKKQKIYQKNKKNIYFSVKESVFPFNKFNNSDPILGPEMKSTGEVMGIGKTFYEAYGKAMLGSQSKINNKKKVLLFINIENKKKIIKLANQLIKFKFKIDASSETFNLLKKEKIKVKRVNKTYEGRPNIEDRIKNKEYSYIINTAKSKKDIKESKIIRSKAVKYKIYYNTTLNGAFASIKTLKYNPFKNIICLQDLHKKYLKN
ncbi:MAG: carbamoyl-phosphate synthase large subunit [Buchnera aphidicola (Periphyllus lyropictus)]|uniref:carbamoyl-phosphate synthase large subunit n=1 Tax=Buchnera aphidicola TaxID=9 RepID=UPI001ED4C594|nr:carbamoyl-phosphate synthase large subunit [Buchnera aphidicola]NIH16699.1 carbamoyl-phosphate synthase large subunit [Buchnera aphidicola (Periphyllus lyropictus)]USS94606.1 carbamoyl-phosphate synthase large subunit [Buchnera aphidicola (Periphyllus lyropictus)]